MQPGQGIITLIITSYLRPGNSIAMMFDPQTHSPLSVQIKSYLSDSKDAVKVSAEFGQLPAGPNYVVNATIEGVSKQLTINEQKHELQEAVSHGPLLPGTETLGRYQHCLGEMIRACSNPAQCASDPKKDYAGS